MVIFSRDRMVDVASAAIGTLVIQYVLKLPQKLAENAMMGGLDDWIASTLGLSWAAFFAFIAEWGFSISVATLFVWGVHLVGKRRFERDIKIAAFTQVATATVTGPNPALRKKKLAFPITLVAIFAVGLCVSLIWLFRVYQQTASLAQTISERERAAIVAPFQAQIDGLRKQLASAPQAEPKGAFFGGGPTEPLGKREHTKRTVRELRAIYEGRTRLQADAFIADERGKLIDVEGTVINIDSGMAFLQVGSAMPNGQIDHVECRFGSQWNAKLGTFRQGDYMKIHGTIGPTQNGAQIYLQDCEIIS